MKKRVTRSISISLALLCIITVLCAGTSAAEIEPRYTGIYGISANLNVNSGGRADCNGYVKTKSGYSVDLIVELQRDGRTIKSWSESGSGTFSITESYYVTTGHDYQVVVSANVYNAQGTLLETPSAASIVVSY